MMNLIDSHAHLTSPDLHDQVDGVLERAESAGVERVITIGTDLSDAHKALELAGRYPGRVHAAVGFHPHEADNVTAGDIGRMAHIWQDKLVVALGEMGLDYHYDLTDRAKQRSVFARQLDQARSVGKPIVIHCREAFGDCIPILADYGFTGRRVVFHCFTGTPDDADDLAAHAWRISFTGVVTFHRSAALQRIARDYPIDEFMLETDAPYLSPEPVRGRRPNEPAHVVHTARFVAQLRGIPFETFCRHTRTATESFFDLP